MENNIFWKEFTNIEIKGTSAIKNTFKKIFNDCKNNHMYLVDLAIAINNKSTEYYEKTFNIENKKSKTYFNLYNKLFMEVNDYIITHLKGKDLDFYFEKIS